MSGWRQRAACKDADPELFFAPDGESLDEREDRERQAKAVCARCPVRIQCQRFALDQFPRGSHSHPEFGAWAPTGVWAGLNDEEMLRERRNRWHRARRQRAWELREAEAA